MRKMMLSFEKKFSQSKLFSFISKNPSRVAISSSLLAVLTGLLIGLVIMLMFNPFQAFPGMFTVIGGWLLHPEFLRRLGDWLYLVGPLILTGLSVGFAFKTGLFNIGVTGQYTMGMFAGIVVGIYGGFLGPIHWVVAVIAAIVTGSLWGLLPGLLKAFFSVNEVIASIMFNYIAMITVNQIIQSNLELVNIAFQKTRPIELSAYLPTYFLRDWFPRSSIDIGIILAILVALVIYIVLEKTTFGYELKTVGTNRFAAKYAGILEQRSIILSMSISGALAGMAGALYFLSLGAINSGNQYSVSGVLLGAGFEGIAVALLGQSSPLGILLSASFISFIQRGGFFMQIFDIKIEIIEIMIAAIIYSSAIAAFIQPYLGQWFKWKKTKKVSP
jgi:simple sugar transport system permease protein